MKNKTKVKIVIRCTVFLLLTAGIFGYINTVFERKTTTGAWNYTVKINGYKNEPENSFDILGFGSSHMYCTLNPLDLWKQSGLKSYVLATQQQPLEATYYYVKEALKTQKPRLLIIESYMATIDEENIAEGVAHDAIDPLPWSKNKFDLIQEIVSPESRNSFYFNFIKYHTRWKGLTQSDYDFSYRTETDPYRGYVFLTQAKEIECSSLSYENVTPMPLPEQNLLFLQKIIDLAKEKDIKILLLISPYSSAKDHAGMLKSLHLFATEAEVDILDLNTVYDDLHLNTTSDFYDGGHLNAWGAEKIGSYLGDYLLDQYNWNIQDTSDDADWQEDYEYCNNQKQAAIE